VGEITTVFVGRVAQEMGFEWRRCTSKRTLLMERKIL
jgi:hypothetical protein